MTAQEKLIAIYEQAEKRLFAIIQKKGAFASAAVYERSLLQQVQKELNRLKANSAKTVDELVIENYQNSLNELIEDLKKIGAPIDTDITPAQLSMSKLNTRQIELIARNATGDFNKAINIIGRRTQDMIRTVTLEATAQKLSTGQTIRQMQKSLTEIFKAQNVFSVPYKNGASMPIKKYAEMTARSTTAETQNKAQTTQGMEWGYDLVEMTSHSPTCPICAMYQGRVYAITKEAANGKYKAPDGTPLMFPYLYDTAFAKGYETIHPNCRHRIAIFPARAYKKEELLKFSQKSTAPFEDTRTDAERKAYAEQQAEKRRRNENRKQYERIKAVLPNDAPKSFAGFVRMKQTNSQRYQELMQDYRYIMRESKARYKDFEGNFITFDARDPSKGRDVVKPHNIIKDLNKTDIGKETLKFINDNNIPVYLGYNSGIGDETLLGYYESGVITVFVDRTKTIKETACIIVHEATHAKINQPNTKTQELECYKNEYLHRKIELTDEVIQSIIKHIDINYPFLEWE